MFMYAQDDSHGYLSECMTMRTTTSRGCIRPISPADAQSILFAPSTQNFISTTLAKHPHNGLMVLADMLIQAQRAKGKGNQVRGVSYEVYGFMNNDGNTVSQHTLLRAGPD